MADTSIQRPVPELTGLNRPYWTAGADGVWHLQQCVDCRRLIHPPALRCPHDHGATEYVALSGRGLVESWTVNEHPFLPGFTPPYIVAFVNPVEDQRVRVLTNLVNVDAGDVVAGLPVRVLFEHHHADDDDVYIPVFEPEL
ncbi:DNA-binding protein [Mycolicibacter heraklionensis]|nr:DNA-binding protein [Mycolicibacter heraklionensis]